jgi:hypothetical protein
MGAAIRGPVRLDAVSVTAYSVLSRANTSYQPACTGVSVVRDEEAAGSNRPSRLARKAWNPRMLCQVRRTERVTLMRRPRQPHIFFQQHSPDRISQ